MCADPEAFPDGESVIEDLERYCSLDTLALAKLLDKLEDAAQ